jgi:hypothetical protein
MVSGAILMVLSILYTIWVPHLELIILIPAILLYLAGWFIHISAGKRPR